MNLTYRKKFRKSPKDKRDAVILLIGYTNPANLLTQQEMANTIKIPLTTLNHHVKRLTEQGFLKKGYMFYELTEQGKKYFTKIKDILTAISTKKLRGHKIIVVFNIIKPPKDYDNIKNKIICITKNNKFIGYKTNLLGSLIIIYSRKIVATLPDIYANNIEEIYAIAANDYVIPVKNHLEQMFAGLKIDDYEICNIQIDHIALQHHPLAIMLKSLQMTYQSENLTIDHSKNIPELEATGKNSIEIMEKILDYEKAIAPSNIENTKITRGGEKFVNDIEENPYY